MEKAVVLIQCPDSPGIVARISDFLYKLDANIIQSDQFSSDYNNGRFFMRTEFCFSSDRLSHVELETSFATMIRPLLAEWKIFYANERMRMGILVSKYDHCLFDLLYRWRSGELDVQIPFIISNHEKCMDIAQRFDVDFHFVPFDNKGKTETESSILSIVTGQTDFLVLARYMQILSGDFIKRYSNEIINIHHSFLPSFRGADPYRQAHKRGVKVIGATAHYVTTDLDEGPIITQLVEQVSHRDSLADLKRKGRNLEKNALANAIHSYIEHRILKFGNRTIVF